MLEEKEEIASVALTKVCDHCFWFDESVGDVVDNEKMFEHLTEGTFSLSYLLGSEAEHTSWWQRKDNNAHFVDFENLSTYLAQESLAGHEDVMGICGGEG